MKPLDRKATLGLLAAAAIAVPIAGCGGDDSSSGDSSYSSGSSSTAQTTTTDSGGSTAASGTLKLAADPSGAIKFDKTSLTAPAGKVTIDFINDSPVPHAVEIEGNGVSEETDVVTGGKATLTTDLKPGTYEFYCPVGDHKEDGMKGTLTVQ